MLRRNKFCDVVVFVGLALQYRDYSLRIVYDFCDGPPTAFST